VKHLTFKEYLESKERLRGAITNIPRREGVYTIQKYCKLVVGDSKHTKEYIALKPKQKVLVEWLYDNIDNPTVISIYFEGVKEVNPNTEYETFWDGQKLQKWLIRNTAEKGQDFPS